VTTPDPAFPLLPLHCMVTTEQLLTYGARIVATWRQASPDQMARGRAWYHVARDIAEGIGAGNVTVGAGILAALSPMSSWEENIRLATRCVSGDVGGHTGDTLAKVRRIMDGEDPADVLPDGSKTHAFYRCIADPTDPEPVCVDRHAHDIVAGRKYGQRERGLSSRGRYSMVAHAYRTAAQALGEIPSVVQAVTWCVCVDATRWQRTV